MEALNKKAVAISIVMALFTTFLAYIYIKRATTTQEVVEYINVYVAAKTLPARHKISNDDIRQEKVTKEYLNGKAVLNKSNIVGKRLKDRVIEGEQILSDRLVDEGNLALAFIMEEGKRAVSINVNEQIQVANLINPGDFVDVIATFQKEEMEDSTNKYIIPGLTKIIIQNVQVLAIGQNMNEVNDKSGELPKTVTLAVSPQDAEKLVFSSDFGVLRLALRAVGDDQNVNTNGVIREDAAPKKGLIVLPQ